METPPLCGQIFKILHLSRHFETMIFQQELARNRWTNIRHSFAICCHLLFTAPYTPYTQRHQAKTYRKKVAWKQFCGKNRRNFCFKSPMKLLLIVSGLFKSSHTASAEMKSKFQSSKYKIPSSQIECNTCIFSFPALHNRTPSLPKTSMVLP